MFNAQTLKSEENVFNFPLSIEINTKKIDLARRNDSDMISNVNILYLPESCAIMNIDEIENQGLYDIFNRPILNKNMSFPSEYSQNPYFNNIINLLGMFNIDISENDIINLNNSSVLVTNKILTENINLYIYRTFGQSYKLFIIEYECNSHFYDFNLKIGSTKNEIVQRFNYPAFYSVERDIFIYSSFQTFRQINLTFENEVVKKVQIISWGGP
jgi:hypothetical protein